MSDIILQDITSGYNLQKMNDNFEKIEDVINTEVLHTEGGNNVMQQSLDMNSNRIINLPVPINLNEPVRLVDLDNATQGVTRMIISDTPPANPLPGQQWFASDEGRAYVWYVDNDSGQWVEYSPQSTNDNKPLFGNITLLKNLGHLYDGQLVQTFQHTDLGVGGGEYYISTLEAHRDLINAPTWVPDGFINHYCTVSPYVAVLRNRDVDATHAGVIPDYIDGVGGTDNSVNLQGFFNYIALDEKRKYTVRGNIGYSATDMKLPIGGGTFSLDCINSQFYFTGDNTRRAILFRQEGNSANFLQREIRQFTMNVVNNNVTYGIETQNVNSTIFHNFRVKGFTIAYLMNNVPASTGVPFWHENNLWNKPEAVGFKRFFQFERNGGTDSFARTNIIQPFGVEGIGCDYWFYLGMGLNLYDSNIYSISGNRAGGQVTTMFYLGGGAPNSNVWSIQVEGGLNQAGYLCYVPPGGGGSRSFRFHNATSFLAYKTGIVDPAGAPFPQPDTLSYQNSFPGITAGRTNTGLDHQRGVVYGVNIVSGPRKKAFQYTLANNVWQDLVEAETGLHNGSNGQSILTDLTKNWNTDQFVGRTIKNNVTGATGTITSNTATTVTASLSSGTWSVGDSYSIELFRFTSDRGIIHYMYSGGATTGGVINVQSGYVTRRAAFTGGNTAVAISAVVAGNSIEVQWPDAGRPAQIRQIGPASTVATVVVEYLG